MMKKNKQKRPLKPEEKFMIFLGLFLLVDIGVHLLHPAYSSYKSMTEKLEKNNIEFQNKIVKDFIPVLWETVSNSTVVASSPSLKKSSRDISILSPASSPAVSSSDEADPKPPPFRQVTLPRGTFFFQSSGVSFLNIYGFNYQVGDYFDNSPIIYINPVCMETLNGRYTVPDKNNSFQSQPQTVAPTVGGEDDRIVTVKEIMI